MPYIPIELNRHFAALESNYGAVPAFAPSNAFQALKTDLELQQEYLERKDITGTRSFAGVAGSGRRQGQFQIEAYMVPSSNLAPFFQGACGGAPQTFAGGQVTAGCTESTLLFAAPHGLAIGRAVGYGGELRFVTAVGSSTQVTVDPPFSSAPPAAAMITPTVSYPLATSLPSLAIYDAWTPSTAQQRILCGGCVDQMEVNVQGDFHQVKFQGKAQDVIDSVTFAAGQGGLSSFPAAPSSQSITGAPLAGNLGQIWLGSPAARFSTLARARLVLANNLDLRGNEFGSEIPLAAVPGPRQVTLDFEVFELDDASHRALYAAAHGRLPLAAHLQLGAATGGLFAAYLKNVVPQVPKYATNERQLRWSFTGSRAAGDDDDELWIAVG